MNNGKIKNRLSLKLLFDAVMMILLSLMYHKMVICMAFHEIGGLFLIGLFILHLVINHKWIIGVSKRLFDKSLPAKTRIGYLVNFLLLISFFLIGISGIFISKVIFHFSFGMIWKMIHYSSAAMALVLIGIHIGLHLRSICSFIEKKINIPPSVGKIFGVICLTVLFVFGIYSMKTTSFMQWISMPFAITSMPDAERMSDFKGDFKGRENFNSTGRQTKDNQNLEKGLKGKKRDNSTTYGQRRNQNSMHNEGRKGMENKFSILNILVVIFRYTSIAFVFASITLGFELLFSRKRKVKL